MTRSLVFAAALLEASLAWPSIGLAQRGILEADGGPILSREFTVTTADHFSIAVHQKRPEDGEVRLRVLLVHGTWGTALQQFDFPGRSVMDYLARRRCDVYALDLRGMGDSQAPANYFTIGMLDRLQDLVAVAGHIRATTGEAPVVAGLSQGGLLTGLLAATHPQMVKGVGLFSIPANGFYLPPPFIPLIQQIIASGVDRWLAPPPVNFTIYFAIDPLTNLPTIDNANFARFQSMAVADSVSVILQEASPQFFASVLKPVWPAIRVPTLVVDGGLDILTGPVESRALYDAVGAAKKKYLLFPGNGHGWFLEDNFATTQRAAFDALIRLNSREDD